MKKLKIYLDTSAIGYLDEHTSPGEMNDMLALWEDIKQGKYDVSLSRITLDEIYAIGSIDKRMMLAKYLAEIVYTTIEVGKEIENIGDLLKSNGLLISDKHRNDRLHIGCAIVHGCDVIVSYNFRHLANVRTIKGVRGISNLRGYGNIDIVPAAMLIEEGADFGDS